MQVTTYRDNDNLSLTQAIMLYTSGRSTSQSSTFATIHSVEVAEHAGQALPQIMPGKPMTQQAVIQVLQDLAEQSIATTDILTDKVLSISQRHIVWYLPAGKRRIFIDTKTNGRQSAIVPHPTLIFAVVDGGWSIFAVAKAGRPNQDTLIYHAPFLNVYDNGLICTGSAKTPKSMAVSDLKEWEDAFFNSKFTHVNGQSKVKYAGGDYAFLAALMKSEHKKFPVSVLRKRKQRLGDLIKTLLAKGLGNA